MPRFRENFAAAKRGLDKQIGTTQHCEMSKTAVVVCETLAGVRKIFISLVLNKSLVCY